MSDESRTKVLGGAATTSAPRWPAATRSGNAPGWPAPEALVWPFILAALAFGGCARQQEATARDIANYAGQIRFSNFKVGVSENMAGHSIYYIDAVVQNGGNRSVAELRINARFRDVDGQVVFRDGTTVIHPKRRALSAGESREVRLGFEGVPAAWNRAAPDIEITHIAFE